jgi:ABC-type lipoprotein export system ATPase subunit
MTEIARSSRRTRASARRDRIIGRLIRYEVTELFGTFDYRFDLDAEGITILTGVNGSGKSTILRTIDAISTGNWVALFEIPFKFLSLGFDGDRELTLNRDKSQVHIALTGEKTWSAPSALITRYGIIDRKHWIETYEHLMMLEAEGRLTAADRSLRNELVHTGPPRESVSMPAWLQELSFSFPVLFITDQRLIVDSPNKRTAQNSTRVSTRVAADEAARQIAHEISAAKSAYANRSQVLDRDLPQRVVKALGRPPRVSVQSLRQSLDELTRQSKDLESVGLSPTESVGEFEDIDLATENVRSFIKVYIEDTRKKLSVLEPLRIKLQLFTEFLKQHYGRKYVQIDPERGFTIMVSGDKTSELQPSKLSSGEQQILVLAHEILFKATPGTLVLIDEPELSLHVLWQASFVEDLALMGQVNNLSFLLATHSPTLIGGREDLKRSLDVLGREG